MWGEERNYLFVVVDTDEGLYGGRSRAHRPRAGGNGDDRTAALVCVAGCPVVDTLQEGSEKLSGRPREGSSHPITSHQPGGGLSEHAHGADR